MRQSHGGLAEQQECAGRGKLVMRLRGAVGHVSPKASQWKKSGSATHVAGSMLSVPGLVKAHKRFRTMADGERVLGAVGNMAQRPEGACHLHG
jgi:hypothetical protein